MNEASLTSLGILKVNWDLSGKDYVACFVPMVIESIKHAPYDVVSLPWLQEDMQKRFGLQLPLNPLKLILARAAMGKYLRREHGIFYRDLEKCKNTDFEEKKQQLDGIFDNIVHNLQQYAKEHHKAEWTEDETIEALHDFLRERSLSLLFTLTEGGRIGAPDSTAIKKFITGSFVIKAQKDTPGILDDLCVLTQGNLLANVLYLPDPGKVADRFVNTRVYLDSSVIIYAAGFAGPERAAPSQELTELLKEHGAKLYCFKHTIEEIRAILDSCAARLRFGRLRDSYGPTMEYFIETGRTNSDLELMIARLPEKLRSLAIEIEDRPPYERAFQVDEAGFEKALQNEIHYANPRARINDVDSVSAIARLRRGRPAHVPETCGALFVTSNASLAKMSRQFFQGEQGAGRVGYCVTDYALGNLLWLKNPMKAPELPRRQLLAHAFAAMQPSEQVWKKYLAEIARLQDTSKITTEDYYILRHSMAAKKAMMEVTDGDANAVTEGTVLELLALAKENLRADLKQEVQVVQKDKDRMAKEHEEEKQRLLDALEQEKGKSIQVRQRLRGIASKGARIVRIFLETATFCGLAIGTAFTFPWDFPKPITGWENYLSSGLLFVIFVLSVASLMWGTTIKSCLAKIEGWLATYMQRCLFAFTSVGSDIGSTTSGTVPPTSTRHSPNETLNAVTNETKKDE